MTDYLDLRLTGEQIGAVSVLGLAHIGDCVYELMVRSFILKRGRLTSGSLHHDTVMYVAAPAQARLIRKVEPMLTEEERAIFRRGRNARVNSVPKNAKIGEYHAATGLEALFGWLHLNGEKDRLNELFGAMMEGE